MDEVDAEFAAGRDEQRNDHENDRRRIEHAAKQQDQEVDPKQERDGRNVEPDQRTGHRAGNILARHHVVQDQRTADHDADRCGGSGAFDQDAIESARRQRAVKECREQKRVEGRYRGGLGRRRDATIDAVEQDDRHQQRGECAHRGCRQRAQWHGLLTCEATPPRHPRVHSHQHHTHHEARNDAAKKEVADRSVGDERVEHHRNGGGNDRPDRGRGRRDRGGIPPREVTRAGHHADDDLADARRVRDRRSAHAREDKGGSDIHVPEPAAEPAHQRHAKGEQPIRDRARVHDVRRDNEKRHGEKHERVVEPVHQLLARHADALPVSGEIGERADQDCVGDRHADRRERQNGTDTEQELDAHAATRPSGASRPPRSAERRPGKRATRSRSSARQPPQGTRCRPRRCRACAPNRPRDRRALPCA